MARQRYSPKSRPKLPFTRYVRLGRFPLGCLADLLQYRHQQAALANANGVLVQTYGHSLPEPLRPPQWSHRDAIPRGPHGTSVDPPSIATAARLVSLGARQERPAGKPGYDGVAGPKVPVTPGDENGPQLTPNMPGTSTKTDDIDRQDYVGATQPVRVSCDLPSLRGISDNGNTNQLTRDDYHKNEDTRISTPPSEADKSTGFTEPGPLKSTTSRPAFLAFQAQDANLPSPSLSPVTAAANLARTRHLASQMMEHNIASDLVGNAPSTPTQPVTAAPSRESGHNSQRSLLDIPEMIRMFDAMPEQLQNYVGFQLLKCCSKASLKSLSYEINQALKIDPFDAFPVEIGLKITSLLDAKDLSTAAQVSRRWRRLVNSDELTWKLLMDEEGLTVSEEELERANREGWGWQSAGRLVFEQDLRAPSADALDASQSSIATANAGDGSHSSPVGRSARAGLKRKASTQVSGSKRQKHREVDSMSLARHAGDEPATRLSVGSIEQSPTLKTASGPFGYASAAARSLPKPVHGLPSLLDMHLYRSLYQRQQFIRQSWLGKGAPPQHLAFGAHNGHVVTCLLFDDNRIITGSDDNLIHVYDTKTGVLKSRLEGHDGGVWAMACDGDTLVSGSTDRTVRIWNIATEECKQVFQGHTSTVRCLVILKPTVVGQTADGTPVVYPEEPIIITGSRDSSVRVWKLPALDSPKVRHPMEEANNPYAIRLLQGHHNSVRAIAAHGDTLVSGSYDHTVRLWKISTGETVHRLSGHNEKVYSVVLDQTRGRCISGSMDKLVKVWSLDTGDCLFNLTGHSSLVGLLDLQRDLLVSAAADGTLRVWDPANGRRISRLEGHRNAITCFQHDGQKVVSGSDSTLKLWDIKTGKYQRDLLDNLSGVWQVKFDHRRLVAAVQRDLVTYIEVC